MEVEVVSCLHCKWHGQPEECTGGYDEVTDLILNFCPRCGSNDLTIIKLEVIKQE
jgi:Zn finger protein HypA/HybF involved in hydrogenase expression